MTFNDWWSTLETHEQTRMVREDMAKAWYAAANAERDLCASCVPTSWLDPLLTGPDAVIGKPGQNDIEVVLEGVRVRIMARSNLIIKDKK